MSAQALANATVDQRVSVSFLWLEITGKCQLTCVHCYADSGPNGSHGSMAKADWLRVIDEGADLGVSMVQFIGGEPTLHPHLPDFIERARSHGIAVEVFSNLVHVTPTLWETFSRWGVQLATSWYSDRAAEHERITGRRGSHTRTIDGVMEALRRDIPLRVGVIGISDRQRVEEACQRLAALGVTDVRVDHLRHVGRGDHGGAAGTQQLCGNCANGVLAVMPDGEVRPCVFTRWIEVGNVHQARLATITGGECLEKRRRELQAAFAQRSGAEVACSPSCTPNAPCSPACNPSCVPQTSCQPRT